MTCDRAQLSAYRDGELPPDLRHEVDAHLRGCATCTAELHGYMRLAQTIRSMPTIAVPPSVLDGVRRSIAEREAVVSDRGPFGTLVRSFGPAVATAAVALSVLVLFRPGAGELAGTGSLAPSAGPSVAAPVIEAPPPPAAQPPSDAPAARPAPPVVRDGSSGGTIGLRGEDRVFGMPRSIARLYRGSRSLQAELGAPALGSRTVTLIEQSFQGGLAVWRSDTREVYILNRADGRWAAYPDSWRPGSVPSMGMMPPPGAMAPVGGFAYLWQTRPDIRARLGWAVYEQRGSGGAIQSFDHGVVIWSPHGLLYVLTGDGKWKTYPDPAGPSLSTATR
jgi:hypothetical protein